jgi:hypothetical protein
MAVGKVHFDPSEEWLGVICHNQACGRPVLITPIRPEMLDDAGVLTVRLATEPMSCPHCQTESVYRTNEMERLRTQFLQ